MPYWHPLKLIHREHTVTFVHDWTQREIYTHSSESFLLSSMYAMDSDLNLFVTSYVRRVTPKMSSWYRFSSCKRCTNTLNDIKLPSYQKTTPLAKYSSHLIFIIHKLVQTLQYDWLQRALQLPLGTYSPEWFGWLLTSSISSQCQSPVLDKRSHIWTPNMPKLPVTGHLCWFFLNCFYIFHRFLNKSGSFCIEPEPWSLTRS